MARSRFQVTVI